MIYEEYSIGGYLYHHGIQGQKWGKRNGPPYPLKDSDHSPSEKKAGWKSSLNSTTKINKSINKLKDKNIKDVNKEGFVVAIPPSLFATYLVATTAVAVSEVIGQKITDKKIEKEIKKDQERKQNEQIDKKTGLYKKNEESTEKEDLAAVNRYFKHSDMQDNATSNCVYCSVAYEFRRRGYDVSANPRSEGTNGAFVTQSMFKNTKNNIHDTNNIVYNFNSKKQTYDIRYTTFEERKKVDAIRKKAMANNNKEYAKSVINNISKEQNSRGSLFVQWGVGGGHAMCYKVVNGEVTLLDPQSNKVYSGKSAERLLSSTWLASNMRLDKASINYEYKKKFKDVMS